MKLKLIAEANFRKGEHTNFAELNRKEAFDLKPGEVVCLVSKTGNQLCFVYAPKDVSGTQRKNIVLRSEKLRLTHGGTWNPLLLTAYAKIVGIELDGLKHFQDYYKKLAEAK